MKLQTPHGTLCGLEAADLLRSSEMALDTALFQASQFLAVVALQLKCMPIKGWLEDGLCREEHSSEADLCLEGLHPAEEICVHKLGRKVADLTNSGG